MSSWADVVGWGSSAILVCTIASQVSKQWREGKTEGVSKWLFFGQMAASAGFTVYSTALHSWVFVVTNSLMLASAVVGAGTLLYHRRRQRRRRRSDQSRGGAADLLSATPQRSSLR